MLHHMKRTFTLILFFLVGTVYLYAQNTTLKGTVSDEAGVLPGVSVLIKGSQNGTMTDQNGIFQISVSNGQILTISALGFETQTIKFAGQQNIKVILKSVSFS